ncbi:uncharacterized protein Gasu_01670 [Galdieria sulphuraria]|uniref:BFN domain-containing protein n=1 Tax=Galdieria sulphuraria TaxID=130081 RepID=M2Y9R4_GALSU|nr:uncharacterized protein Gasu_01670 [Galdieria sulphuraria]EME32808.1 hypothetical protein Gasu_01670 [Galdieria sulphuraria]|eukprot:XP_005709328.1 hypothetical protein Gasu_01670 [Galdieria sulphuraria]
MNTCSYCPSWCGSYESICSGGTLFNFRHRCIQRHRFLHPLKRPPRLHLISSSEEFQTATWSPENDPKYVLARVCAVGSYLQGHIVLIHSAKDPYWMLPILIGSVEAQSIALALSGVKAPRPSTYDLFYRLLLIQGAKIVKVAITHVSQKSLYARIWIKCGNQVEKWMEARPSDALNIGIRFGCDLYVNQLVLRHSGERLEKIQKEIAGSFVRILFPESFVELVSRKSLNAVVFHLVNEAKYSSQILKWRAILDVSKRIQDSLLLSEAKEKLNTIYPIDEWRERIKEAVNKEDYDKAAYYRDQIIEWLLEKYQQELDDRKEDSEGALEDDHQPPL